MHKSTGASINPPFGLGRVGVALLSAALTWIILSIFGKVEHMLSGEQEEKGQDDEG